MGGQFASLYLSLCRVCLCLVCVVRVVSKAILMALFKSIALELEDAARELERKNAEACYALLEGWQPKLPIMTPIVELPALPLKEDTTAFPYDYSHLPSRYCNRQRRWSEI